MGATYDPALSTDKDWVRFLIGDRGPDVFKLDDDEIAALLVEEANKYLAAARAGDVILTRSQGLVAKEVDTLRLAWSDSPDNAYRLHIQALREKGALLTLQQSGRPSVFKVL